MEASRPRPFERYSRPDCLVPWHRPRVRIGDRNLFLLFIRQLLMPVPLLLFAVSVAKATFWPSAEPLWNVSFCLKRLIPREFQVPTSDVKGIPGRKCATPPVAKIQVVAYYPNQPDFEYASRRWNSKNFAL